MRRALVFAITLLLLAATPVRSSELIDAVVATVNRQPILLSEWQRSVAFEALMQQKPLANVTPADRIAALQRMIDRRLLELQMPNAKPLQASPQDLQSDLAKLRAQIPGASDDRRWQGLLAAYGLTETSLAAQLQDQVRVMNFIDVRLRPAIHIPTEEVETYYQTRLVPDLREAGKPPVPLSAAEPNIRELLVQQRIDELLDAWLHNLRQQSRIQSTVPIPSLNQESSQNSTQGGL